MYCLFFLGFREALTVASLKSLFVLLTRGPVGAAMSFAGGLLSVCAMALLQKRAPALHTTFVSVTGAVSHNMGQLFMAALILRNWFALAYLPVLFLAGVVMGLLTGVLLKTILPYLAHLDKAWK
jgi:heptaprenyl diphosphate synthase